MGLSEIFDMVKTILSSIFSGLFSAIGQVLTNPIVLFCILILIIICFIKNQNYKKSTYYQITKTSYIPLRFDVGKYGEYLTFKHLRHYEKENCRFLFNIYIPKDNSETTEIDVMMLSTKGLFVFESKNYSGWIFGSETQKNWTQTLPQGRKRSHKENFYNPIFQNRSHIKHLKNLLGEDIPMHSIIVFSERCTLKDIKLKSDDIFVINRYDIEETVNGICNSIQDDILTESQINGIYEKLYPCTQVSDEIKAKHIENINKTDQSNDILSESAVEEQPKEETTEQNDIDTSSTTTNENKEDNQVLKCPKCGSDLTLRTASRGKNAGKQFYGCSNFPKCRYIQQVLEQEIH